MQVPRNNILGLLQAGLLDCHFATPQGKAVLDLKEWSKDPEHKPVLLALAIKNSLQECKLPNGRPIEVLMRGKNVAELFHPDATDSQGMRRTLTPLLRKVEWINQDEDGYAGTKETIFASGMHLTLGNLHFRVFMRMPCEAGDDNMVKYDKFEVLLIRMTPDMRDWMYAVHSDPTKPEFIRTKTIRHASRQIRKS